VWKCAVIYLYFTIFVIAIHGSVLNNVNIGTTSEEMKEKEGTKIK